MKTVIIGDIHGCSRALDAILQEMNPDPSSDRLILLGDLYDRGPDSHGVFHRVRELADQFGDRFVLLRGNHEDYLLREKLSFAQRLTWERVGRHATVRSFHQHHEKMEDTAEWLRDHSVMFWKAPREGGGTLPGVPRQAPPGQKVPGQDIPGHALLEQALSGQAFSEQALSGQALSGQVLPGQCLSMQNTYFQCVHAGIMIDPPEANDTWTLLHDHSIVLQNQYKGPLTITGHIGLYNPMWYPGRPPETRTKEAGKGKPVKEEPGIVEAGTGEPVIEKQEILKPGGGSGERSEDPLTEPQAGGTEAADPADPVRLTYDTVMELPDRGVICIDTGCGKGGRLTGMSIENNLFILRSVPETGSKS